jgi:hypothetical protein
MLGACRYGPADAKILQILPYIENGTVTAIE